ncbi:predicted protein [Aspergillus nidulans FGSC A4]|uniref:Uncharacterized protein n=1 Tax=Emericella nidulans (strain FGSC A4 / ATCC 38163 / CBS 112.46 / NRRL 194 / M139) TaxID=227321 RepID=Q5B307_EMENI|nr:hypothetical protein [Aspergillus nidulans FGSC A4]EAA60168.1 predicted protein [Aspergillus nidulans FGSC A4]CBF76147.1 TPA: conserved hypothetical protein [Aspergillus nidulans FGSC A4]|eukprot:XP_662677.1 predicted protein [Aspergillus nidulans FGSC A4]
MSGVILEEEADYGCFPFDIFVSDRWDHNHNATRDGQEQWEQLVWEWESLTLTERYPYQKRAESENGPPELSEEIKRVLATHQTAHERNISLISCDGWQTVWLRTCYDPGLADKYKQMKSTSEVPGWGVSGDKILDDPARYDFDDDGSNSWQQVLIRVPGITDFSGVWGEGDGGSSIRYRSHIESGLIKILWLDEHGQVAWENRLDTSTSALSRLTGSLLNATSLVEMTGYDGTRGTLIEN